MPEVEVTARELDFLARAGVASAKLTDGQRPGVVRNGANPL